MVNESALNKYRESFAPFLHLKISKAAEEIKKIHDLSDDYIRRIVWALRKETPTELKNARIQAATELIKEGRESEAIRILQGLHKKDYQPTEKPPGYYMVIGCPHFPWNNKRQWSMNLEIIKDLGDELQGVILAGDVMDMHSISRHAKGKITMPGWTLSQEYSQTNTQLDRLDKAIGNRELIKEFLYGNHEMWWAENQKEVQAVKIGEGAGVDSPKKALRLTERGYNVQTNYKTAFVTLGDLEIIHGTYVNIHAAHKHLQVMKRSVMFFHTHRIGSYHEGDLGSYNCGFSGDKEEPVFGYMDRNQKSNWANGIAMVYLDQNNISHVQQLKWRDSYFFNGKLYA